MSEQPRSSNGKRHGLRACSDARGVIAALAMDQRGSLRSALAKAAGAAEETFSDDDLTAFKLAVSRGLSVHASAILLDPLYGLPAAEARADGCGLMLAYEHSGYQVDNRDRIPALLQGWSVAALRRAGADAIKVLVHYDPNDDAAVNERKHALVRAVGEECREAGAPFFLEPVTYDRHAAAAGDPQGKPERVRRAIAEWTKPEYGVDVLKVEIPVAPSWLEPAALAGSHHRRLVLDAFRRAGEAATRPLVFLSAGVDMDLFVTALELAGEGGTPFNGVLCGRATWKGGIGAYASGGEAALEAWLSDQGRRNIERLNAALAASATPLAL